MVAHGARGHVGCYRAGASCLGYREFVRELAKDKNVGEIYSDESNRGYKGNLPFLNVLEADAWIESVESDGGKL